MNVNVQIILSLQKAASVREMKEDDDPNVKSDSTDHGVRVSGIA